MLKYITVLISGVALFSGCSTTLLVHSVWDKDQITVDGKETDWQYRTFYLNDHNLNLGIRNNGENLFIFVKIIDQHQRRNILTSGFTIWFDSKGEENKEIGIRIPGRGRGVQESNFNSEENLSEINPINEIEILHGEKGTPIQVPVISLKNIQFASSRTSDELIYELKIPLIGVSEGGFVLNPRTIDIGIGFIAGKFEMPKKDRTEGEFSGTNDGAGREPSVGMGQGRGGGGGRRAAGGRGGEIKSTGKTEPFDVWLKVNLAEKSK